MKQFRFCTPYTKAVDIPQFFFFHEMQAEVYKTPDRGVYFIQL